MDRANVYNDDEFDVFSRSHVDNSRIQKGKKSRFKKVYEADKESIDKVGVCLVNLFSDHFCKSLERKGRKEGNEKKVFQNIFKQG